MPLEEYTDDKPPMVRRVEASQATLDHWKGKPFKYGQVDCARMTAFHLRKMGHRIKLPASGSYASVRSAKARLAERGFADLIEAMDGMGFERIPPAMAATGDVLAWPSTNELGALAVALGGGRVVAFHEDAIGAEVIHLYEWVAAWRVYPA